MFRLCAPVILFITSCSTLSTEAPTTAPANQFATTIARIERSDPHSPAVLSVRLSYAEFLVSTDEGPCQQRLGHAQEELDRVETNPQTQVMFPDGWARAADLEYRLHLARADCSGHPARPDELRAAVAAARRAAELYGNSFDYHAAVIMQFNTAILLHQLGDDSAAITALETALALDREYGFQADAQENYTLWLTWKGQSADNAQVASLMQDFPKRQASLKFAWHPGDAHVSLEESRQSLWESEINRSHAGAAFERHIGADSNGGWKITYTQGLEHFEPGVWPTLAGSQAPKMVFSPAPLPALNFRVTATGGFLGTTDSEAFAVQLIAATDARIRARAPSGADTRELMTKALDSTANAFAAGLLVAKAAENFQLETSMWAGATLDQGVWYRLSAPLSLRGLPQVVVQQRLEFAFTRMVPCTAAATEPSCVELVVRSTPDQEAVAHLIANYAASSATRIVMDPATLLSYSREDRLYWYASIGQKQGDAVLQSEHLKSTTIYNAQ